MKVGEEHVDLLEVVTIPYEQRRPALEHTGCGYRFLSFGDAMLISRAAGKAAPVEG